MFKKIISFLLIITLLFYQGLVSVSLAYALEATSSAQTYSENQTDIASELNPIPESLSSSEPTPTPPSIPDPLSNPESSSSAIPIPTSTPDPTPIATSSAEPSPTPDTEVSPQASDSATLDQAPQIKRVSPGQKVKSPSKNYVEDQVLVKFKDSRINLRQPQSAAQADQFAASKNLEIADSIEKSNVVVYDTKGESVETKVEELTSDPDVEYVEPNYIREFASISSNDISKDFLWGLDNFGQTVNGVSGTSDADIDGSEAWALSEGSGSMIVAVIDSGVSYNHPDLSANMWDGTSCKDENGNVLGNCLHGFDFEDNDKDPLPTFETHGTHVAGTIAAAKNNSKGVIGVAPNVKIMVLKSSLAVSEISQAVDFAIQNGAKIINASYGGSSFSQTEYDAVQRFKNAGGVFVAAAGNDSLNNDSSPQYPCNYNLENIICVAATDQNDNLASFSNYGSTSVDVAAPGKNIYSTLADLVQNILINETFESIASFNVPTGWVKTGDWGVLSTGDPAWGNVLWADTTPVYKSATNSSITSQVVNLSGSSSAKVSFWTACDTEYTLTNWEDYMSLWVSGDGTNFAEITRWDEAAIDNDSNSLTSSVDFIEINLPINTLTSNFKFRFGWITDPDNNTGTFGKGCLVDDVQVVKVSLGTSELYGFLSGTSMATPHVTGLAALILSLNPTRTYSEVKSLILNTGDFKASLLGKTVSGKRVNVFAALSAINGPTITGLTNDSTPTKSKTWSWDSNDSSATYRFLIDQNPSSMPTGAYGNTKTTTQSAGDGTYYLHVQAKGSSVIESSVVTVSSILDNTAPTTPSTPVPSPSTLTNQTTQLWTWSPSSDAFGPISYIWSVINATTNQVVLSGVTAITQVVTNLVEGIWNFVVKAEDGAGNQSGSQTGSLTVDTTNPTLVTYTIDNTVISPQVSVGVKDSATIDVEFSEAVNADIEIWDATSKVRDLYNSSGTVTNPTPKVWDGTNNSGNFVSEGIYTVRVTFDDRAGNQVVDTSRTITVDNDTLSVNPIGNKSINEGSLLTFTAVATDEEGGTPTYSLINGPMGAAIGSSNGVFDWIPTEAQGPGSYTFSVQAVSGALTESEQITVTVNEVNSQPATSDLSNSTNEDSPKLVTLTGTDSDLPLNILTFLIVANPANGTLSTISGNQVTYTPNSNFNGVDSFTYKISDGLADSNISTVNITVNSVNDAPVASNQSVSTNEDTALDITLGASDVDGDNLTYSIVSGPAKGSLGTLTGNQLSFTPNTNVNGNDQFTFKVNDGISDSNIATVSITINSINDTPVCNNVTLVLNEDNLGIFSPDCSDVDADSLTYQVTTQPQNGNVSTNLTFTPNANYNGSDSFGYKANDGISDSNTSQVNVTVNPINDAPVAVDDQFTTTKNNPLTLNFAQIIGNDSDVEGNSLTITFVANFTNGLVNISGSDMTFTPSNNFLGVGGFDYTLSDGSLTDTGHVTINVNPLVGTNDVLLEQNTNVTSTTPNVVLGSVPFDATVNVPSNVNATLDLTNLLVQQTASATIQNSVTINSQTTLGNMTVNIPSGITISGSSTWTGIISTPQVLQNSSVTLPETSGFTSSVDSVVEIGFGNESLTFDKAARILIPGKAGKFVGYSRLGTFTQITDVCSADTQAAGDVLPSGSDCKIDVGSDLAVWTKHFTQFVTYTQTANLTTTTTSSSTSSSGGSQGGPVAAPQCNDSKPGSAPKLLQAIPGQNSVRLVWEEAKEPVSYYLVAYGLSSGNMLYGNPNIGGKSTTSYTINNLSGDTTYYFKVRAGNGCAPGEFSNELSVTPPGGQVTGFAASFTEGVLGSSNEDGDETADGEEVESATSSGIPGLDRLSETPVGKVVSKVGPSRLLVVLGALALAGALYYFYRRKS